MSRLTLFAVSLAVAVSPEHSAEDEPTKVGAVRHYGQQVNAEGVENWSDEAIGDILRRAAHPGEVAVLIFDTGAEIVNRADVLRLPEVLRLQGELDELRERVSEAPPQKPGGRVVEVGPVLAEMIRKSFDEVFPLVVDMVHFYCNPPKVDVADVKDLIAELVKGGGGMIDMGGLHMHVGPQGAASVKPEPETTTPEKRLRELLQMAVALAHDDRCPDAVKAILTSVLPIVESAIASSVG